MNIKNFLINKNSYQINTGILLFFYSLLDVFVNSFFNINILYFLPNTLNALIPLLIGFLGLYLIRIENSGSKLIN